MKQFLAITYLRTQMPHTASQQHEGDLEAKRGQQRPYQAARPLAKIQGGTMEVKLREGLKLSA
jgi:hypothetical protein